MNNLEKQTENKIHLEKQTENKRQTLIEKEENNRKQTVGQKDADGKQTDMMNTRVTVLKDGRRVATTEKLEKQVEKQFYLLFIRCSLSKAEKSILSPY